MGKLDKIWNLGKKVTEMAFDLFCGRCCQISKQVTLEKRIDR